MYIGIDIRERISVRYLTSTGVCHKQIRIATVGVWPYMHFKYIEHHVLFQWRQHRSKPFCIVLRNRQ